MLPTVNEYHPLAGPTVISWLQDESEHLEVLSAALHSVPAAETPAYPHSPHAASAQPPASMSASSTSFSS